MEAGGVEPPSRDISGQASTCIVACLGFAPTSAKRQAFVFASSLLFHNPAANIQGCYPAARRPCETRRKKFSQDGPLLSSQTILVVAS